jgi:hypothetical protein
VQLGGGSIFAGCVASKDQKLGVALILSPKGLQKTVDQKQAPGKKLLFLLKQANCIEAYASVFALIATSHNRLGQPPVLATPQNHPPPHQPKPVSQTLTHRGPCSELCIVLAFTPRESQEIKATSTSRVARIDVVRTW